MATRGDRAAVLIDNPNAGRLSDETRADVVAALRSRITLDALSTASRGAAIKMATEAVEAGERLVIAFGGDGHVNEVANGVAGTDAALAIIPGGTMNVFARALGIPTDAFAAVDHLVGALEREPSVVTLGKMDDRYFTFSAGCGFDAEAAERVERDIPAKRRFGELFFYWSALRVLTTSYRHRNPSMILSGAFGRTPVAMAIACNAGPYAYLHDRAIRIAPDVRLDGGLDVFALRSMRLEALPSYVWRCVVDGNVAHHHDAIYERDQEAFELSSDTAFARHVDGEPLAAATSARFMVERDVLKVRA